ncbi:post-GPI attachment to proteins factor 3, partial [Asbolus verrucosus]
MGRFDYGYNMQLNIIIGTFTAICWFGWCTYNRIRQPYVWKCAVFVALAGIVMLLEIIDRPPIFWVFDCHSLWHLSTAPLTCLFYSFVIDD